MHWQWLSLYCHQLFHCYERFRDSSTVTGTILQQPLARLFNSHWHNYSTVTGTIIQQSLEWIFISGWHDCSTVAGTIIQQSLAQLFNSHWHDCLTVTGTIIQQWLAWFFNSDWHDCSTVTGTNLQQWLARQPRPRIFLFFYAGRILQQWCSISIVPCSRNTTHDPTSSDCFCHLHQPTFSILILYVINQQLRREYV